MSVEKFQAGEYPGGEVGRKISTEDDCPSAPTHPMEACSAAMAGIRDFRIEGQKPDA